VTSDDRVEILDFGLAKQIGTGDSIADVGSWAHRRRLAMRGQ
jgi:hypothetical protein